MALIAVYLGIVDENSINDMSIVFFNSVLSALGKRVNYDAVVNYAGNSFAKDSWKLIQEANPLVKEKKRNGFDEIFAQNINVKTGDAAKKELESIDWADIM